MASASATSLNYLLTFLLYLPLVAIGIAIVVFGLQLVRTGNTEGIKTTLIQLLGLLGYWLTIAWEFVKNNPYRLTVFAIFTIYVIISYYFTFGDHKPEIFKRYSRVTNIIWIIIGVTLSLVTFSLLLRKNLTGRNAFPRDASFLTKTKWAFGKSAFILKLSIGLSLILGLLFALAYLVNRFPFLSDGISVLISIALFLGTLFLLYAFGRDSPFVQKWILDNKFLRIIYYLIFLVPCGFITTVDYLYEQFKNTPAYVYYILLAEIVFIALYISGPIIARYLYTYEPANKGEELTVQHEFSGVNSSIISHQRKMKDLKAGVDVEWSRVIKGSLYESKNMEELKDYLTGLGFKPASQMNEKGTVFNYLFGKGQSLEAATTYITTNGATVVKYEDELRDLVDQRRNIEKRAVDQDKAFTSKVLLDKAIYTDSLRSIGSFENLDYDTGDYNYRYGLSSWFFIHEQPPSARLANIDFTSILNYAGKPNILYNVSKKTIQFRMVNSVGKEKIVFETQDFPMQRWNNVVVNYDGGTLDIFINKKLVHSSPNVVPYMKIANITVGADKGVSGGVANVTYFSAPLGKRRIDLNYDLLENKEFPNV